MAIVSSRDVQEIVEKLSSDKAKAREEGIKLLNTWLEGERSFHFCKFIGQSTAKLKPDQIPHSETWPFLVSLLIQSASTEISSSKRKMPKIIFAKTLRVVVQRAEDAKYSGKMLPLLSVVKPLYNHVWDVLSNVPSFQSEYGIILRHLLAVKDYSFQMKKRIYCNLVLLFIEKIEASLKGNSISHYTSKDEAFRHIVTLHSLLENPPGDYADNLREDTIKGFVRICSFIRDEGKISRKLVECVNTYLLNDGPNLGCQALEIHNVMQQFVFRCWLTTHDRVLKDALMLYARLQLNLTRDPGDGCLLVEQLLDVICKDLDQGSTSSISISWGDGNKDDKFGALSSSHCVLVELAAVLFYKACLNTTTASLAEKRVKRESAAVLLREALTKGKWLWNAAFCFLTRNYHTRISKDLFLYWFEAIWMSFDRILNSANMEHAYDGLLWTLRSLQELSFVLLLPNSKMEKLSMPLPTLNEFINGWQLIWSSVVHGLPVYSNIIAVVDVALMLLGNVASNDLVNTCVIPQDVWDLQLFKRPPSTSMLYFFSCYFLRRNFQVDLRDILHLRKNLLKATLSHFTWKGTSMLNERTVLFLPSALYALCAGCAPFSQCFKEFPQLYSSLDVTEVLSDSRRVEDPKCQCLRDFLDCSVEVLTEIDVLYKVEVSELQRHPQVHLPREIKDQLLHEVETSICGALVEEEMKERSLPDMFFTCSLLSNLMHGSFFTRKINVSFLSKLSQYLLAMLDYAVNFIQQDRNVHSLCCLSYDSTFEETSPVVGSVRSFLSSPLFIEWRDQNKVDLVPVAEIIHSVERLLKSFVKLYEDYSQRVVSLQPEMVLQDIDATDNIECSRPYDNSKTRIIDMELDVNDYSTETDILTAGNNRGSGDSFSAEKWKMGMISLISCFFSVSHVITWDILFKLMEKESDTKVQEKILYHLCQHPHWSSSSKFLKLVNIMDEMIEEQVRLKLDCCNVLSATCGLLATILSLDSVGRDKCGLYLREMETEQCFLSLGNAIHKLAQFDLLDWFGRVKLIDCICNLILLNPQSGQTMIERLLLMLQDADYRVRLSMARKIGVLFQTWDGHEELFHDICSNFGVPLVVYSKQKVIMAKEVLTAGPRPQPAMETVLITLMHLALYSEKIELDAVFMMCVVSATDPCHRELVCAIVNKLSNELQYTTRMKYLEQLLGSLIFRWVTCGVSLVALIETRHLFLIDAEPGHFLQYCCHWLLPALLLNENSSSDLNWVAKVTCQPLTVLVVNYFASIFAVCMALHCSEKPGSEKGTLVLRSSILHFGQISENERDKLIKKHMVSIVSCMLSLSSCSSDPVVPFFLRDTVSRAIQAVVDGFLDMDDSHTSAGIVDKINIFRPDRVFMFMVEIHYRIAAAIHYRHKCHHLAGIEVLIGILGHRAAIPSTSNYIFNLIGPLIGCDALQDQCYHIISALLIQLKRNLSVEINSVVGEQLQFLVSKLVACCKSEAKGQCGSTALILSLVHSLIVDSDPSMYDYIRELEPFPESEIFGEIRKFHEELCLPYSIRDHLLKFAKHSCYLPPRILLSGLQALHKKLLKVEAIWRGGTAVNYIEDGDWHSDHEMVHAVWTLVRTCGSNEDSGVRELVSDFISMVGAGDPHSVVFHLPAEAGHIDVHRSMNTNNVMENFKTSVSEELLIVLMKLLKKYLMDDSVKIVDMASQTLRGILSTERGQRTLESLDSHQRSLIEVHSKGVNNELVENFLLDLERKSKVEAYSLEKSTVWVTQGKSFDMWICLLVYSLIVYCNDVILRLCQDISLLKAEIAELLLPCIFVNLAGRSDLEIDLQKLISLQLQEHIFTESNKSVKSIKVLLNCLNELRICHVLERSSFVPSKRENSKNSRPSSYSSKTRSAPAKARDSVVMSSGSANSASSWEKVYWLSLDYLLVAKSAVICGSYFTSLMYVEYWCEEHFKCMTLGVPDFSQNESLPDHIEVLVSAVTSINEPDSLYGILQSHKLTSQIITFEHEGNWGKALEYYDLQVRSNISIQKGGRFRNILLEHNRVSEPSSVATKEDDIRQKKPYKGLIRSLQQIGCSHLLELYCQGLTSREDQLQHDLEFAELQYEAAWRAGNWDLSLPCIGENSPVLSKDIKCDHFNENLHSCLRALQEGDLSDFCRKLKDSKQELVWSVSHTSEESPEYIYLTIIKLQMLHHLGNAWDLRWRMSKHRSSKFCLEEPNVSLEPLIPSIEQLSRLNMDWSLIMERAQIHMNLLEPFIAFRRVLLQILSCRDCTLQHLLQSASILRKGSRFSHAAAALHEFKFLSVDTKGQYSSLYWLGRLEEAKLLRAQGQHEMAISLAEYILQNYKSNDEDASDVYRLIGKWLAETRSSNSKTILEKYLKPAVSIAEGVNTTNKKAIKRQCQTRFHLAHYADALFRSHEERLNSNEWQAAMRLRRHKTVELEALLRRLRSSTKGEKTDYSLKIRELQKQVAMDQEEAQKLQDDRDNFLSLALEGYKCCLVMGDKYDVRVVFRLVSLWFSLSSRKDVVNSMLSTINEVQSFKFIPLVYQIASRMGNSKDVQGTYNFQHALVSLVKKMAIDHPYHTILQLLALANGDRIKDKQCSRNSFVVDMDKKLAAENLLKELLSYHGAIIRQMKQMVEIYIKLAELETRREDTNKRMTLPRELRSAPTLELVPVVTATVPIDHNCQYKEGTFPYFKGLVDSVMIMNGINAPKVVECLGSDGCRYRQLAKSGNDDLRQDAVMEQFFGLVNTFLRNHRDTWKRRLGVRTYKVVPFTPSAGVLEWVNGTLPLGEYLIGSMRNGGAHGRYGIGDWSFLKCREHMSNERDKRRAFLEVCKNFRPVMHYFFLERFLQPADWFKKRLAYTHSVAASSMVGYIVGLGDRHSMNILIDQATAEVVHIDLGVAFEQGLMLKTPERVPFRLTRDIIDGMGVTGVEGVFRRCCEETLSVMRTNKEALLTIIEVFIHDPLYKWALSPLKALQRQKETDDDLDTSLEEPQNDYEGNKDAARALLRVKQKLDGYEEGEMRSVHGQVQQLIQDAIDPERLCQMFPGWGAWL